LRFDPNHQHDLLLRAVDVNDARPAGDDDQHHDRTEHADALTLSLADDARSRVSFGGRRIPLASVP
jgi:hypothetical protein